MFILPEFFRVRDKYPSDKRPSCCGIKLNWRFEPLNLRDLLSRRSEPWHVPISQRLRGSTVCDAVFSKIIRRIRASSVSTNECGIWCSFSHGQRRRDDLIGDGYAIRRWRPAVLAETIRWHVVGTMINSVSGIQVVAQSDALVSNYNGCLVGRWRQIWIRLGTSDYFQNQPYLSGGRWCVV